MKGIAYYHTGECPFTPHPPSYRTLLYAFILRSVPDYRDKDANIYVSLINSFFNG